MAQEKREFTVPKLLEFAKREEQLAEENLFHRREHFFKVVAELEGALKQARTSYAHYSGKENISTGMETQFQIGSLLAEATKQYNEMLRWDTARGRCIQFRKVIADTRGANDE